MRKVKTIAGSYLPVASINSLRGDHLTDRTPFLCPFSIWLAAPDCISHSVTLPLLVPTSVRQEQERERERELY